MSKTNFDIVTPAWIVAQLKQSGKSQRELASGVNVDDFQVSKWISGDRNPSKAARAAIWYYFNQFKDVSG